MLITFASCITTDKALRHLEDSGMLPGICAAKYPPNLSYTPGTPVILRDTLVIPGDSVPCPPVIRGKDTVRVKVRCPDNMHITDTIRVTDTVRIELTDKLAAAHHELSRVEGKYHSQTERLESAEKGRKQWRTYALVTWGVLVLGIIILVLLSYLKAKKIKI